MSQAGGEKELILGNKQLVSLFFVVVALCGVFFAMGYMVRGNSLKGSVSTATDTSGSPQTVGEPVRRQQPEPPAPSDSNPPVDQPPVSTDASSAAAPPATETQPAQDTPAATLSASASPAPKPEEKTNEGGPAYVVQVAALARPDAESTARTLREQHLPAVVAASSKEGLYRVLVGPYHLTTDVAGAKAKLKTLGFADTIVQKQ